MALHDDVLLTALSLDGERPLVVPVASLMAELVAAGVKSHLERLTEDGLVDEDMDELTAEVEHTWSGAPFDAEDFFGPEDCYWRPDPRLTTEEWLCAAEPDLALLFVLSDSGWGTSYVPAAYVPAASRQPFERLLVRLGHAVRRVDDLHDLYLDPPSDLESLFSRLAAVQPAPALVAAEA